MDGDLYSNLLRATDNTQDITTEKYGVITKIDGYYCNVKEDDTELEHMNVPILNGCNLKEGSKVVIGFINNSIYNVVCYGTLGSKTTYTKDEIDSIVESIESGEIDMNDYDVGFTYDFGIGGIDDSIIIHTNIYKKGE